jgi:hypothetical protein
MAASAQNVLKSWAGNGERMTDGRRHAQVDRMGKLVPDRAFLGLLCAIAALGCSAASHGANDDAGTRAAPASDARAPHAGESGCGTNATSASDCVDEARLKADIAFIAKPRVPGSPHWQAVQDLCKERFEQYGFEVELHKYDTGTNVIGTRRGSAKPDEQIIVSAHYDHIANCAGADDNATGVAGVLETARVLERVKLERSLILACWDEEERGLLGSIAYATRAKGNGDKIIAMTSLEMIGYKNDAPNTQKVPTGFDLLFSEQYKALEANQFRADFVSVVALDTATPLVRAFERRAQADGLRTSTLLLTQAMATSPQLADLNRSDHAAFWLAGFPSLMLNDSANFRYAPYHCKGGDDVPELLDYGFLADITRASVVAQLEVLDVD